MNLKIRKIFFFKIHGKSIQLEIEFNKEKILTCNYGFTYMHTYAQTISLYKRGITSAKIETKSTHQTENMHPSRGERDKSYVLIPLIISVSGMHSRTSSFIQTLLIPRSQLNPGSTF